MILEIKMFKMFRNIAKMQNLVKSYNIEKNPVRINYVTHKCANYKMFQFVSLTDWVIIFTVLHNSF